MTTSNSYNFSTNATALIKGALRLAGVIASGETPTATQYSDALESLNMMVKGWESDGMPIWDTVNYTITPVAGQTTYTLNNPKPLKCLQAWNRNTLSNIDIPMRLLTRNDYNMLGNKSTLGNPIQAYFQPNRDDSSVYLFPTPDSTAASQVTIYLVCQRPFEDFDSLLDSPDFPQEWYEALKYGLATRLAGEYNIDIETRKVLQAEAAALKQAALSFGNEEGSIYLQRDFRSW